MHCFVVVFHSAQEGDRVQQTFPNGAHYPLQTPGAWLVAADHPLPAEVANRLGMNDQEKVGGIVIPISNYNGYYDPSVWDWLRFWMSKK